MISATLLSTKLIKADLTKGELMAAYLQDADLKGAILRDADLKGAYSDDGCFGSFEFSIQERVDKPTDLKGIKDYDPKNPQFKRAIFGAYTQEEADEIIREYNESKNQ